LRVEVDNPGYALRPDMPVDVEVPISGPPTMTVPREAVLDSGLRKTVLASARIAAGSSRDPVCAMEVDERQARATGRASEYGGRTYLFCSMGCKRDFDKEPAKYAVR
jgi:YHS domain-containing protein